MLIDGDYLIKCNKDSNGRMRKYFLIINNNIAWASRDTSSKFTEFPLRLIRGIVYGKVTPTF